jgi:hypothetical protein
MVLSGSILFEADPAAHKTIVPHTGPRRISPPIADGFLNSLKRTKIV